MTEDSEELLRATPFRPFAFATTDHCEYVVDSPKRLTLPVHGQSVHFHSPDGRTMIVASRHIIRVTLGEARR
jgi:hypothetical protein